MYTDALVECAPRRQTAALTDSSLEVPLHAHDHGDAMLVLDGEIELLTETGNRRAGAGTVVAVPPGTRPGLRNPSPVSARVLILYAPDGGFSAMVRGTDQRGRCKNQPMEAPRNWTREDGHEVSTDHARLDVDRIHRFLAASYWSPGIPHEVVARAISNSLPFGLFAPSGEQVGFARAITDGATYAYLADVYVEAEHRDRGLGKFLIACVMEHPELQGLRRWALATADAHGLYERHGFLPPAAPQIHLFIERAPAELWAP